MILLDSDNESFTLQNKWWSIIPISFDRIFGEELRITVFPGAEDIAKEFEDKYGDGPMSDQALSFLENKISERYLPLGYAKDMRASGTIYRLSPGELRDAECSAECVMIDENTVKTDNLTSVDIEEFYRQGHVCFVCMENGKIVSAAVTDSPVSTENGGILEVGVETADGYCGHGYASAALNAICSYLSSRSITAEYRADFDNPASRRVAEKAGFSPAGEYYYYIGGLVENGV